MFVSIFFVIPSSLDTISLYYMYIQFTDFIVFHVQNARHKASLLLVDRTLDIVNVVGHHWETLLDKILSLLPKLPQHTNDVSVNMAPVCSVLR